MKRVIDAGTAVYFIAQDEVTYGYVCPIVKTGLTKNAVYDTDENARIVMIDENDAQYIRKERIFLRKRAAYNHLASELFRLAAEAGKQLLHETTEEE